MATEKPGIYLLGRNFKIITNDREATQIRENLDFIIGRILRWSEKYITSDLEVEYTPRSMYEADV